VPGLLCSYDIFANTFCSELLLKLVDDRVQGQIAFFNVVGNGDLVKVSQENQLKNPAASALSKPCCPQSNQYIPYCIFKQMFPLLFETSKEQPVLRHRKRHCPSMGSQLKAAFQKHVGKITP
jgi:hypothetical protein